MDPPPASALVACSHPAVFFPDKAMSQAEAEIAIGRLGNALIDCGARRDALADYIVGLRADLGASAVR